MSASIDLPRSAMRSGIEPSTGPGAALVDDLLQPDIALNGNGNGNGNGKSNGNGKLARSNGRHTHDALFSSDSTDFGRSRTVAERRSTQALSSCSMIAYVDVKPVHKRGDQPVDLAAICELAVRRLARSVRPEDQMCMLPRSRLALCMGNGAHRVAPSALGMRLARAMGDHLSIGQTELELDVAVGIAAASSEVEMTRLSAEAWGSVRCHRRQSESLSGSGGRFVAVTHVPDDAPSVRALSRRVLLPVVEDDAEERPQLSFAEEPWLVPANGARRGPRAKRGLRVMLVDPVASPEEAPRAASTVVAAAIKRLGAIPVLCGASEAEPVHINMDLTQPAVAVIVLEHRPFQTGNGHDPYRLCEHVAHLTRSMIEAHLPVIALGMGASAVAVAACVEHGAVGLLDVDLLGHELARVSSDQLRCNGSEPPRGSQLPRPFDALVQLTPSERRVLFNMMEGRSAADIAANLIISVTTVRSHIRSILRKLNVSSQLAAVALAFGTPLDQTSAG